ncbi:3D-(3,5/4)-trihydroxycyclohexane-1,2-dione hydrolase [subsurface metagenome]
MEQLKTITGAETLLLSLMEENADTIFGYPGGAMMLIYDKLYDKNHVLKHILVRHKQGAAHAAQAYALVAGKAGVCFATSGPGSTNLITGITNANLDSIPVVFITAQVPSDLPGTDAFRETDMVSLSMPVIKWNYQVTRAEEIPNAIAKTFFFATTGRPGPVLIDITKDAQLQESNYHYEKIKSIRLNNPKPKFKESDLRDAIIVTDVGQNQMLAVLYYQFKDSNTLITSGKLGTMGFGLPAAMGAQVGQPDKTVVLFTGDGGFQMTAQEPGTIFQYSLPVKIEKEANVYPMIYPGRAVDEIVLNDESRVTK